MLTNQLLVVIHVVNQVQALANTRVAFGKGADGVFLINHEIGPAELLRVYDEVREEFPDEWVGLNFLKVSPVQAVRLLPRTASGLWLDDGGIDPKPSGGMSDHRAKLIRNEIEALRLTHVQYFGGVAFKYRAVIENYAKAAKMAAPYMNVVTTSGPETGQPPTLEKIQAMRNGIPHGLLGVASGMTPENVDPFLDFVDFFLVFSGISKLGTEDLDPARVRMMSDKMRRG